MAYPLTNPDAAADFVDAYVQRWGCPPAYARKLLSELLDERAHQEAERLRDAPPSLGDTDTLDKAADYIDPSVEND